VFTLVIGGAASGKSKYAEGHVLSLSGRRVYLATMEPAGAADRIEKHRRMRAGKGFETAERSAGLSGLDLPSDSNILLECLGNLTANELYAPGGGGGDAVLAGVEHLLARCAHLTAVTNEVCSGGTLYAGDTLTYMKELSRLNRVLAARADRVVEVVCGLPNVLKGAVV